MPAVIKLSGKQYLVSEGDRVTTERLNIDADSFEVDDILSGGKVSLKKISDSRAAKVRILKFKNKTGYKRTAGHRQLMTTVEVISIGKSKAVKANDKAA